MKRVLKLRCDVLAAIRSFFAKRDFLEIETPLRIPAPASEVHIDAEPSGEKYLRTSPEFHMKRLLAAGYERIYQMGACFRRGESGRLHNPEFTMLEWYRLEADQHDILLDAKELIGHLCREVLASSSVGAGGKRVDLMPVWECMTVRDAFLLFAGWDPLKSLDPDRFDLDLVEEVIPGLPADRPVVLTDYPVEAGGFVKRKHGDERVGERWELFISGVEIINACSEICDASEYRAVIERNNAERGKHGKDVYPVDEDFLRGVAGGLPRAAGAAMGVDRLVALLAGADSLDAVIPFRS